MANADFEQGACKNPGRCRHGDSHLSVSRSVNLDGKGRALDNVIVERFWRSVKYEEVYLHDYASMSEARKGLERYFRFYNRERPHQSLGWRTPAETCLLYTSPSPRD